MPCSKLDNMVTSVGLLFPPTDTLSFTFRRFVHFKKRFASLLHRVLVLGHTSHLSPYFKRFQWNISLMTPEKLGGHSQTMELILRDIFDFFSFLATTTLTNKGVKFWIILLILKVSAPYKKIIVHKWLPILWIPHAPNTIVTSRDACCINGFTVTDFGKNSLQNSEQYFQ